MQDKMKVRIDAHKKLTGLFMQQGYVKEEAQAKSLEAIRNIYKKIKSVTEEADHGYKEDDRVIHPSYGRGTVHKIEGNSAYVKFEKKGMQKVTLKGWLRKTSS